MPDFQPLLLEDLDLSLPQLAIRRICVNRHSPETNWVRAHRHDFEQLIVYLNGSGVQMVGGKRFVVGSGTVMSIPRQVKHAFIRESDRSRSPMCLVIDLKVAATEVANSLQSVASLNATQMAEIRRTLVTLAREADSGAPNPLRQGAAILEVTGVVLEATAGMRDEAGDGSRRHLHLIEKVLADQSRDEWTPAAVVKRIGIQHDVLNRALKRECGLTLGQLLAARRVDTAKRMIESGTEEIQSVAAAVGIDDRNYFSRWFRRQTGLSPTEWRRQGAR